MTQRDPAGPEAGHILRNWNARQYLDYYYGHRAVPDDEAAMFAFIADGLRGIDRRFPTALDLGCGPVLHHAAQAVPWVDRLDMADVHDANLEEIRSWLRGDPGAFDWSVFLGGARGVLDAERGTGGTLAEREGGTTLARRDGGTTLAEREGGTTLARRDGGTTLAEREGGTTLARRDGGTTLAEREAAMRQRIRVLPCDLRQAQPLGHAAEYPLVMSYYCAEWVIPSIAGWRETMHKVVSLVARGGWLFLAGVHATDYCMINGEPARCARVTSDDVRGVLGELGFDLDSARIDVTPGLRPGESGIQGTFMAYARRTESAPA